jgi:hypothetical protein
MMAAWMNPGASPVYHRMAAPDRREPRPAETLPETS